MAVTRFVDKIDPFTKQKSRYSRTYNADGTFNEAKDRYLAPVYDIQKGDPGEPGPSARQAAIDAGKLPANATDAQFIDSLKGRGIKTTSQPSAGILRFTLDDDSNVEIALPPGAPGRSVASVSPTGLMTFSDGDTQQLTLPSGPPGQSAPIYAAIAGADFNIAVAASGVTVLPNIPANADAVVISYSGGDCYATTTGTIPTNSSPPYADGTQVEIDPRAEVLAYQAIIKSGVPRLIGYFERRIN